MTKLIKKIYTKKKLDKSRIMLIILINLITGAKKWTKNN